MSARRRGVATAVAFTTAAILGTDAATLTDPILRQFCCMGESTCANPLEKCILSAFSFDAIHSTAFSLAPVVAELDLSKNKLSGADLAVVAAVKVGSLNLNENPTLGKTVTEEIILGSATSVIITRSELNDKSVLNGTDTVVYETLDLSFNSLSTAANLLGSGLGLSVTDTLSFESNSLTTIEGVDDFVGVAGVGILDLRYNLIQVLEQPIPGAEEVYLSANELTGWSVADPFSDRVSILDLSRNLIGPSMPDFGSANLTSLNLAENQIEELPTGAMDQLTNLEVLQLHANNFQAWTGFQDTLPSLTDLDLSSNVIRTLGKNAFGSDTLPALESLNLRNNEIIELDAEVFTDQATLATLLLDYNQIKTIETDTFIDAAGITHLELSNNLLTKMHPDCLAGMNSLETLLLNDNLIEYIDPETFEDLAKLTTLDLSNNRLYDVDNPLFDGLTDLLSLDLRNNRIEAATLNFLSGSKNLEEVQLAGNPGLDACNGGTNTGASGVCFQVHPNILQYLPLKCPKGTKIRGTYPNIDSTNPQFEQPECIPEDENCVPFINSEGKGDLICCDDGFIYDPLVNGTDNPACYDIDECALGKDDCDAAYATCFNTPGSFVCCPRGFVSVQDPVRGASCQCDASLEPEGWACYDGIESGLVVQDTYEGVGGDGLQILNTLDDCKSRGKLQQVGFEIANGGTQDVTVFIMREDDVRLFNHGFRAEVRPVLIRALRAGEYLQRVEVLDGPDVHVLAVECENTQSTVATGSCDVALRLDFLECSEDPCTYLGIESRAAYNADDNQQVYASIFVAPGKPVLNDGAVITAEPSTFKRCLKALPLQPRDVYAQTLDYLNAAVAAGALVDGTVHRSLYDAEPETELLTPALDMVRLRLNDPRRTYSSDYQFHEDVRKALASSVGQVDQQYALPMTYSSLYLVLPFGLDVRSNHHGLPSVIMGNPTPSGLYQDYDVKAYKALANFAGRCVEAINNVPVLEYLNTLLMASGAFGQDPDVALDLALPWLRSGQLPVAVFGMENFMQIQDDMVLATIACRDPIAEEPTQSTIIGTFSESFDDPTRKRRSENVVDYSDQDINRSRRQSTPMVLNQISPCNNSAGNCRLALPVGAYYGEVAVLGTLPLPPEFAVERAVLLPYGDELGVEQRVFSLVDPIIAPTGAAALAEKNTVLPTDATEGYDRSVTRVPPALVPWFTGASEAHYASDCLYTADPESLANSSTSFALNYTAPTGTDSIWQANSLGPAGENVVLMRYAGYGGQELLADLDTVLDAAAEVSDDDYDGSAITPKDLAALSPIATRIMSDRLLLSQLTDILFNQTALELEPPVETLNSTALLMLDLRGAIAPYGTYAQCFFDVLNGILAPDVALNSSGGNDNTTAVGGDLGWLTVNYATAPSTWTNPAPLYGGLGSIPCTGDPITEFEREDRLTQTDVEGAYGYRGNTNSRTGEVCQALFPDLDLPTITSRLTGTVVLVDGGCAGACAGLALTMSHYGRGAVVPAIPSFVAADDDDGDDGEDLSDTGTTAGRTTSRNLGPLDILSDYASPLASAASAGAFLSGLVSPSTTGPVADLVAPVPSIVDDNIFAGVAPSPSSALLYGSLRTRFIGSDVIPFDLETLVEVQPSVVTSVSTPPSLEFFGSSNATDYALNCTNYYSDVLSAAIAKDRGRLSTMPNPDQSLITNTVDECQLVMTEVRVTVAATEPGSEPIVRIGSLLGKIGLLESDDDLKGQSLARLLTRPSGEILTDAPNSEFCGLLPSGGYVVIENVINSEFIVENSGSKTGHGSIGINLKRLTADGEDLNTSGPLIGPSPRKELVLEELYNWPNAPLPAMPFAGRYYFEAPRKVFNTPLDIEPLRISAEARPYCCGIDVSSMDSAFLDEPLLSDSDITGAELPDGGLLLVGQPSDRGNLAAFLELGTANFYFTPSSETASFSADDDSEVASINYCVVGSGSTTIMNSGSSVAAVTLLESNGGETSLEVPPEGSATVQ
eukprot:Clim_evm21s208 gene=Clim_evmTU21s208